MSRRPSPYDDVPGIAAVLDREPSLDSPGWSAWRQELSNAIAEDAKRYRIVRMYFRGGKRTIARDLTLDQAQAHCHDPETSSSTCRKAANVARTARMGEWFDGYEVQK